MNILSPRGVMPAPPWMLPAEFQYPNWTTLSSASAQEILEARGVSGMSAGYGGYGAAATRVPRGRVDVHTKANFDHYLNMLREELAKRGEHGGMRTEQERYMGGPEGDRPGVNTYYLQRIGTAEYTVAWSQVTDPSSRSGGFYGYVEFEVLEHLDRMKQAQFVPSRQRTAGAAPATRAMAARVPARRSRPALRGYSAGLRVTQRLPWRRYAGNVDL